MADFLRSRFGLGVLILLWTLAVWLPRIWIIPVTPGWDLARLVLSMLIGMTAALVLFRPNRATRPVLLVFGVWTIAVWGRSLWNYWSLDNPLSLRLVHTVLAAGFFYLAWRAFAATRGDAIANPDQGDRDQQGQGERAALP